MGNLSFSEPFGQNAHIPRVPIKDNAFGGCTSITKIFIPGTVQTMGWGVFASWTNAQTIYVTFADAESRPDGWSNRWTDDATVVYGATSAV